MELIAGRFDIADSITWLHFISFRFISCAHQNETHHFNYCMRFYLNLLSRSIFFAWLELLTQSECNYKLHVYLDWIAFALLRHHRYGFVFFFARQIERFKRQCHLNECSVLEHDIPWRRRQRQTTKTIKMNDWLPFSSSKNIIYIVYTQTPVMTLKCLANQTSKKKPTLTPAAAFWSRWN